MAVIALEKLEDQLNCSICMETYSNPKLLQCNHVYCQQCLARLIIRDQQRQLILTCPNCRQATPVPANGVAGLQAAFHIKKLMEMIEEQKKSTVGCPEHDGREVELYCNTCEKTICFKCIMKDERHHSHDYEELDKAFERYQQEITSSLEPLEKQLETIKKALQQFEVCHDEISNQQATIETSIHNAIARFHEALDVRKTELIGQLHQLTQAKLKSLAAQRDQIEAIQTQLSSCLIFMRENLTIGNPVEALLMKGTTVRQVKELTTTFQPDMLEPSTEANMMLSLSAGIPEMIIHEFGKILELGPPDHSKCSATGEGVKVAALGESSVVHLQTLSSDSLPSKEALDSITCELVSEITGTRAGGSVERRGQSQYKISYQPTIKGRHQLHIKVGGQHIRGSPFSVAVTSSVEQLGPEISTMSEIRIPMGVAVNQRGEVVVAEGAMGRHCVAVFSPSGERLRSFGTFSSDNGCIFNPIDVAVDGEGNIFVADQVDHRIQKFSAQGVLLKKVRIKGNAKYYPCGVAFCASTDKVYVSVNDHIQILHSDLRPAGRFGKEGSEVGEFNNPQHIACDSTGNVYVADFSNSRIQCFTSMGKFLRMLSNKDEGNMTEPYGIAIDSGGNVYVSEYKAGLIFIFSPSGQLSSQLDLKEKHYLCGLAVDSCGVLYVCGQEIDSIKLF